MLRLLLSLLVGLPLLGSAQSLTSETGSFQENTYSDTEVPYTLYYPADEQALPSPWPVLVLGHGFQVPVSNYDALGQRLAELGYIVVLPDVANGFSPNHTEFAQQIAGCAAWVQGRNTRAGDALEGKVAPKGGCLGHSMGAGCCLFAGTLAPELNATVGMAPNEVNTTPSLFLALEGEREPILIISAAKDGVSPEIEQADRMYEASSCTRYQVSLDEGGHCNFTDTPNQVCQLGAQFTPDAGTLSPAQQQGTALVYMEAFFATYLKDDDQSSTLADESAAPVAVSIRSQEANCAPTASEAPHAEEAFSLAPNPATHQVLVNSLQKPEVFSLQGQRLHVPAKGQPGAWQLLLDGLAPGSYLVRGAAGQSQVLIRR